MPENETVWLYDVEGAFHASSCRCPRHCGNCFSNLATEGVLGPKARYCSEYCKGRAKRERALDRLLSSAPTAP